jgi:hypothetical protein
MISCPRVVVSWSFVAEVTDEGSFSYSFCRLVVLAVIKFGPSVFHLLESYGFKLLMLSLVDITAVEALG